MHKSKHHTGSIFLLTLSFFCILASCKKKEIDNEIDSVIDYSIIQQEILNFPSQIQCTAPFTGGLMKFSPGFLGNFASSNCPGHALFGDTAGYFQGAFQNNSNLPGLEFDWQSGCASSNDSRIRNGKFKAIFSKPFSQAGCGINLIPMNYKMKMDNGDLLFLNGQMNLVNSSSNYWQFTSSGLSFGNNSWTSTFNSSLSFNIISGGNDSLLFNEIYQISGEGSGLSRNGKKFDFVIKQPLVKNANFKWIVSGKVELTPEGLETRIIDFGDGSFNNQATFEVNGSIFSFNLR